MYLDAHDSDKSSSQCSSHGSHDDDQQVEVDQNIKQNRANTFVDQVENEDILQVPTLGLEHRNASETIFIEYKKKKSKVNQSEDID